MSLHDDPNRQVVGLDPAWVEGDGASTEGEPAPAEGQEPEAEQVATGYDPGEYTVDEVLAYVDRHPAESAAILDAERKGKNRTTLVSALESE